MFSCVVFLFLSLCAQRDRGGEGLDVRRSTQASSSPIFFRRASFLLNKLRAVAQTANPWTTWIRSLDNNGCSNGGAAPRGSAAAAASLRRRRPAGGSGSAGAAGNTMLQFYTDDAPGLKISPNVVLIMSIGFIAFVAVLHVIGKFYFVPRDLRNAQQ